MTKRPILLVGSVPCDSSAEVFQLLAKELGSLAPRYPDGETGKRINWIRWQRHVFDDNPDLRLTETKQVAGYQDKLVRPFYTLKDGADLSRFAFKELGYAQEAINSYAEFSRMKKAGAIPSDVKFQVCLPSVVSLLTLFIEKIDRSSVEAALEAAMKRGVDTMAASIPTSDLAIQWDAVSEVVGHDGGEALYYSDVFANSVARLARYVDFIPAGIEAGIHFCYGDPGHKHILEPKDAGTCVEFANSICQRAKRKVNWIHLPIPRDRTDPAFYKPLANLRTPPQTEIYLGLIHFTDGIDGTKRRLKLAAEQLKDFGLATECGFGRRDPSTIHRLLAIHREAASA